MIDEKSMLTTPLLTHLCQATGVVCTGLNTVEAGIPFGGLNIVLLGDFHQFPPIACAKHELFNSIPPSPLCQLGRNLYKQFDIIIQLKQQMLICDLLWNNILQCA